MGYSKSVYDRADRILNERRLDAEKKADRVRNAFYEKYPRAKEIENELSHTFTGIARAMLSGQGESIEEIKNKNLALQHELQEIYKAAGVSEESLGPRYVCSRCSDKGAVDGVTCECYKKLIKQIACDDLNRRSPLSLSSFEGFDLSYYPEDFRRKMGNILNYCIQYAKSFDRDSDSIVMTGKTGLGKTHLALSIANEVIKGGHGVIYISAPEMVSALEEQQFNRDSARPDITLDILSSCDLLIIDDLGTEFSTSFSKSAVYNVFNSRISRGVPTIISTNLDLAGLENSYTDRFVSRVTGYCKIMYFDGNDIRLLKKLKS